MKSLTTLLLALTLTLGALPAISGSAGLKNQTLTLNPAAGKAYWITYYLDQTNKKLYITRVYNNDCNHCENEIRASFKKWLIMNDYFTNPMGTDIQSLHDYDAANLEKRRDDVLLKYKQKGYAVVNLSYTYTEN